MKKRKTRSEAAMGNKNARKKDRYHQIIDELEVLLKELADLKR